MPRRSLLLGLLTMAIALTATPASSALASDAAATTSYLQANLALVKVAQSHIGASRADYRGVLSSVRASCPLAAKGAPQNPLSTQLSNEVIGAIVIAAAKPDRAAIKTYLAATAGLHWSSSSVTRAVGSYRSMLGKLYRLSPPDLCADIAGWTATGYATLAPATVSFDRVFYPNWVALGLLPPGLPRFENGAAKQLAKRSYALEYLITNAEAVAVETWAEVMNELELSP